MVKAKGYSIDIANKKSVTPVCRGGYVSILEPHALPNSEKMAWGLQCMFPKDAPEVAAWVKELNQVYAQVLIDKFGQEKAKDVAKAISVTRKFPLRDGDRPEDTATLANSDQLAEHYFLNTNNQFRQPFVIGPMGKPVDPETLTQDDVYSGAWYRVMLEFWYYDTAGNKGISTSCAAIMKVKDDANLGSGTTSKEASGAFTDFAGEAASMLSEVEDEAGAEETGQQQKAVGDFNFM